MLRWKDDQRNPCTSEIRTGYAMQVSFGSPADGKVPGSIYICLPDDEKSFIAGRFVAEIRKPNPPRPSGANSRPPPKPKPAGTSQPAPKPGRARRQVTRRRRTGAGRNAFRRPSAIIPRT